MIFSPAFQWTLAIVGVLAGGVMALRTDGMIRTMRRLMIAQMRMVRGSRYRMGMKLLGWFLLATSGLLLILLVLSPGR